MSEAQKRRYSTVEGRRARSEAAKRGFQKPGVLEEHRRRQKRLMNVPKTKVRKSESQKRNYRENPERAKAVSKWMSKLFSTEESRVIASRQRGGRPVVGTNLETGEEWRYEYLEAIKRDGFQPSNAKRVISGQYRQHKGYTWRYVEVEEEL